MSEDVTRRVAVTFGTGKPLGVHARFRHDGQWWVAYPAAKDTRILSVLDRLLGILSRIEADMVRWINIWPDDAARVSEVLQAVSRARAAHRELSVEKAAARTE